MVKIKKKGEDKMQSLIDQLKHWNKIKPNDIFAIDGDFALTYGETLDSARRLSGGLYNLGLRKKSRVAAILFNN